jgi:hypothetical protein
VENPSHIKEYPTFFLRGPEGDFETNDLEEIREYLKQNEKK